MSDRNQGGKIILYLLIGVLIAFVLIRLPIFSRFLFVTLSVLLIAGLGFGIYSLVRYWRRRREERAYRSTSEGIIEERLEQCREELENNRAEQKKINRSLAELREKAGRSDLSPRNQRETGQLIQAFESERELRRAKIKFFEACIRKLENLLQNQRLAQEIEAKKEELRQLQENHYEELAELEELKTSLELDQTYLDTIETLSLQMPQTNSVSDAERLTLELEEMTRELD